MINCMGSVMSDPVICATSAWFYGVVSIVVIGRVWPPLLMILLFSPSTWIVPSTLGFSSAKVDAACL